MATLNPGTGVISPAAIKFGRAYQLMVLGNNSTPGNPQPVYLNFPLTLDFDVTHHLFAQANEANFSIYGLSAANRNLIQFNSFLKPQPYAVTLSAGYVSQLTGGYQGNLSSLPVVFSGYANVAYTERSGPNLITRINAFDSGDVTNGRPAGYVAAGPLPASAPSVAPLDYYLGGFLVPPPRSPSGSLGYAAQPGTPFDEVALTLMGYLDPVFGTVSPGVVKITPFPPSPVPGPRPRVFNGSAWDQLQVLASEAYGAHVYIENGVCNMLGQNDTLGTAALPILNASSGLLGVVMYDGYNATVRTIFEPSYRIGCELVLQSQFTNLGSGSADTGYSGTFKIVAYRHYGRISGVDSGDCFTDLTLLKTNTPQGNAS